MRGFMLGRYGACACGLMLLLKLCVAGSMFSRTIAVPVFAEVNLEE